MAITNVDTARLSEPRYAQYCIVNGCDANIRCQITALHGTDKVKMWESVDSTKYEIADEDFNNAYNEGKKNVKDAVGYDGHKDYGAVGDAALSAAGTGALIYNVANVGIKTTVAQSTAKAAAAKAATAEASKKLSAELAKDTSKGVASEGVKEATKELATAKTTEETTKNTSSKGNVSAYIAAGIAIATAAKYMIEKPNEDQVKAARQLQSEQLPAGQGDLQSAQSDMLASSEEVMELTEEANDANEEANDKIEDDKTLLDFYRAQYEALKVKAEAAKSGGEKLTPDEKALMQKLAPLMEDVSEDISDTNEEASDTVNDLYDQIEGYQANYDDGAETIAQVEAVTDYAEGFDETTKTMCYVEAGSQGLNAITAYGAAAKLMAGGWWNWALGIAAGIAGGVSTAAVFKQTSMASEVSAEINTRKATQELGDATTEVYETELDSFAGNMEVVEDLEIEIPEDLEVPDTSEVSSLTADNPAGGNSTNLDPLAAGAAGVKDDNGTRGTDPADDTTGANGANGGSNTSGLPREKDPAYVNKMGTGSDWHEVVNGNIKRNSDNDIVKDSNGKVVLISTYTNAIKSATGAQDGEYFSKDDIPKILETLLGSPFDAKMIKKIRNGHKLSSEYAALILGTKDQDAKGTTSVDNTEKATAMAKKVIDFYYPIFAQASTKGWVKG